MSDAFGEAAQRHWTDGLLLEKERRLPNADQLFGFAAECALKRALSSLPGSVSEDALAGRFRKHIDELWNRVQVQSMQKRFPALFAFLKTENPFGDWSVDQRYGSDGAISETALQEHKAAAKRLLAAVGLSGARRGVG